MRVDFHSFWGNNSYKHPPLTDEAIEQAQASLGVILPSLLIELLRVQNGGYTAGFAYPIKLRTSWADDHIPLQDLAGVILDPSHPSPQNLLLSNYYSQEWGLPESQVVVSGAGPYFITLDYRGRSAPTVNWFDVDCSEEIVVAGSFEYLLDNLVPEAKYNEA